MLKADRIRVVIERAKHHIQDFRLGLAAFYKTAPYVVRAEEDPQAQQRIYRVVKLDPVPEELAAIAADVIQNLRGPLDQIAYQLVLDARGTPPDWKVYYPISGSATDYRATRGGHMKCVRQDVVDAIDATEPYKGGKGHALWQLNELNKIPKHQDLLSARTVEDGVDLPALVRDVFVGSMPAEFIEGLRRAPAVFLRPVQSPALNIGAIVRRESLDTKMDKDRRFSFAVTFHTPGVIEREPALKFLQDTADLVDGIITTLGRFLP